MPARRAAGQERAALLRHLRDGARREPGGGEGGARLLCGRLHGQFPYPHRTRIRLPYPHSTRIQVLDLRNFKQVFELQMPTLYERVRANSSMLTILQHFLANSNVSRPFAEILLSFLVGKLPELSAAPEAEAATLLRLFKLVFGSITLFPENEPVLRSSLAEIWGDMGRNGENEPVLRSP